MKTYLKVLGILCALFSITAIILIIIDFTDYNFNEILILTIPLYILIHYLILTRFGFETSINFKSKFFSLITILSFIIIIATPLFFLVEHINEKKGIEILKTPITLTDTTIYNIECLVKTRYDNNNIDYVFTARFTNDETPEIKTYHVNFIDKDGFVVHKITISNWTRIIDSTSNAKINGVSSNGKSELDRNEYARIKDINIAISTMK